MTWLDDYLLRQQIVVAGYTLDVASAALQVGDWFCVSQTDTSGGTVQKATVAALALAGAPLAIAVESAQPGQPVRGIPLGMVPRIISGLATGTASTCSINSSARTVRGGGTFNIGICDTNGTITLSGSPGAATGVAGGASGAVQYSNGTGGFLGAASVAIVASGAALAWGATPAAAGDARFANNGAGIQFRNAANSANVAALTVDGANVVVLGGAGTPNAVRVYANATTNFTVAINGTDEYVASATAFDFKDNFALFGTTPAASGVQRLANNTQINFRNAANSADILGIRTDGADNLILGGTSATAIYLDVKTAGFFNLRINATDAYSFTATELQLVLGKNIQANNVADASAVILQVRGPGSTASNNNGGKHRVDGGRRAGTGNYGAVSLRLNQDDSTFFNLVEATHLANARRVLALCRTADLTTTESPTNAGDLVVYVGDAATVPSANAVTGHIYYSDGGKPGWRFNSVNLRLDDATATAATSGGSAAIPALVRGYISCTINGTARKIPFFDN